MVNHWMSVNSLMGIYHCGVSNVPIYSLTFRSERHIQNLISVDSARRLRFPRDRDLAVPDWSSTRRSRIAGVRWWISSILTLSLIDQKKNGGIARRGLLFCRRSWIFLSRSLFSYCVCLNALKTSSSEFMIYSHERKSISICLYFDAASSKEYIWQDINHTSRKLDKQQQE